MSRLRTRRALRNHHPFSGSGASLYGTVGTSVVYRLPRLLHGRWLIGTGGLFSIGDARVWKTARLGSATAPAATINASLPAAFADQTATFDVRRFKDHVENLTTNVRTVKVLLDGTISEETAILGTATLLSQEARAGGIVRLRLAWAEASGGTRPTVFRAVRTAGPTSPASVAVLRSIGQTVVQIDTPVLSDVSPYTYKVVAENAAGSVTADVLTGISVQADATGPPAPASGTAQAW
jgi:hypothetical protein